MRDTDWSKNFLTIKEFAKLVGMKKSALQFYDNEGIFLPSKHGVEFENRYRLYSPTQITTVKMIRVLREIGVPLNTIKELKESRTPEKLIKLLTSSKGKVADEIKFLQEVLSVVSVFLDNLNEGICATESEITVSEKPEKPIILGDENDYSGSVAFYREFTRFCNAAHDPTINTSYPIGAYWSSMDAFLNAPSLPMRFYTPDPKGNDKKAAGLYLIGYTRGYYGNVNDLPERMTAFAKKNDLVFTGPVYGTCLFDELSVVDPDQYLFQVSASVMETRRVPSRRPQLRMKAEV